MRPLVNTLLISLSTLMFWACQNDMGPEVKAERFTISIGKYCSETGESVTKKWAADDNVGILYVTDDGVQKSSACPLMEGRQDGLFMFETINLKKGDEIIAFLPSDAPVEYKDGRLIIEAPSQQDGSFKTLFLGRGTSNGSTFMNTDLDLDSYWHSLRVTLRKAEYAISKAEFISEEQSVCVNFDTPLNCSSSTKSFFITLAPLTLAKGYEIVFTTIDNQTFKYVSTKETVFDEGNLTEIKNVGQPTEIVVCGDSHIYIIDTERAAADGFENAISWEWDASQAVSIVGADMIRLDDCKVVDNNTKILATSSRSWAVLIDIATKDILWWSYSSKNAHSADLLPDGRIAVACSTGGEGSKCNRIQIFDIDRDNEELSYVPLESAHGVVYNPATQRVYAVGGTTLNTYTLTGWDSETPSLTLESSVNTSDYVTSLHDLSLSDDNHLLLAGNKAALYNVSTKKFTRLPHFAGSTAVKSANYNPVTGACWYTDATKSEYQTGNYDWATNTILYTSNVASTPVDLTIPVIPDFNMYKIRIYKW